MDPLSYIHIFARSLLSHPGTLPECWNDRCVPPCLSFITPASLTLVLLIDPGSRLLAGNVSLAADPLCIP